MTLTLGKKANDYMLQYKNNRYFLTWIIQSYGYQEAVNEFKYWDPEYPTPNAIQPGGFTADVTTEEFKAYEKAARFEYYKIAGHPEWAS